MAPSLANLARPLGAGPLGGRAAVDPDADEAVDDAGLHVVLAGDEDHRLGERAHVAPHVAAIGPQIEDGVADELPGAVVGHVAAAPGLHPGDAARRQRLRVEEHVGRIRGAAQGDHRLVLDEEDHVADGAPAARLHQALLQGVHRLVRAPSQPDEPRRSPQF